MSGRGGRFPRSLRLTHPREFSRVFAQGRRLARNALLLVICPNGLGHPRLGLAVAKRHVKSAVARNRIKRLVRESFRLHQEELPAMDVIVLVRGRLDELDNPAIRAALHRHWSEVVKRCAGS